MSQYKNPFGFFFGNTGKIGNEAAITRKQLQNEEDDKESDIYNSLGRRTESVLTKRPQGLEESLNDAKDEDDANWLRNTDEDRMAEQRVLDEYRFLNDPTQLSYDREREDLEKKYINKGVQALEAYERNQEQDETYKQYRREQAEKERQLANKQRREEWRNSGGLFGYLSGKKPPPKPVEGVDILSERTSDVAYALIGGKKNRKTKTRKNINNKKAYKKSKTYKKAKKSKTYKKSKKSNTKNYKKTKNTKRH
jgi:hypothetical protein